MSSYVLDRDVLLTALGSGRATAQLTTTHHLQSTTTSSEHQHQSAGHGNNTAWIDVNSNAALLGGGNAMYQRTVVTHDVEARKQMSDVKKIFFFLLKLN
jgi:hypothetical protein